MHTLRARSGGKKRVGDRVSGLVDISYVRFQAPDKALALRFLEDFGLRTNTEVNGTT